MNELIELEKLETLPTLPDDWNYDTSVEKTKTFFYKWKNLTNDILEELWVAREKLSKDGVKKSDPRWNKSSTLRTWGDYCEDIGTSRQVVNRWLKDHYEFRTITNPHQPELDENLETDNECPSCGYEW